MSVAFTILHLRVDEENIKVWLVILTGQLTPSTKPS